MPLYEYRCRKCNATSTYLERADAFHFFGVKCKRCGSRKTDRVMSTFRASVSRSQTEVLNDLKSMGNVTFTNSPASAAPAPVGEDGACPSCGKTQPDSAACASD